MPLLPLGAAAGLRAPAWWEPRISSGIRARRVPPPRIDHRSGIRVKSCTSWPLTKTTPKRSLSERRVQMTAETKVGRAGSRRTGHDPRDPKPEPRARARKATPQLLSDADRLEAELPLEAASWVPIGELEPWDRNPKKNDHRIAHGVRLLRDFGRNSSQPSGRSAGAWRSTSCRSTWPWPWSGCHSSAWCRGSSTDRLRWRREHRARLRSDLVSPRGHEPRTLPRVLRSRGVLRWRSRER